MTEKDNTKSFSSKLKEVSLIGVSDITGTTITVLFWFYMANLLGAEQYGQISYFLSIGSIVATASLLGSSNMLSVYLPKNVRIESTLYLISIVIGLASFVTLFFVFSNISIGTYVIGMIFVGLAGSEIIASKHYNSYPKYLITSKILMVGLSIGLFYLIGIEGIIIGLGLALFPYAKRIYKGFRESKIDFSLIKPRAGFMINSFILNLSNSFKGSIDKLIIAPLVGFALLGNYQLGLQFLAVVNLLPLIVFKYTLPLDAEGIPNRKLKLVTVLASIGIALLSIFLAPSLIPLIFPKFTEAIEVIQIVSISVIPFTISLAYMSEFLGDEKIKVILYGSGLFIVVLVSSILLLEKDFGIKGIASGIVFGDIAEAIFYFTIYKFKIKKVLR